MRRRFLLLLVAGLAAPHPATAQGFRWLFGTPPPSRRVPRVPRSRIDVPLPVPRPAFFGEAPAPAASAKPSEPEARVTAATSPPLPPERPGPSGLTSPPAPSTNTATSTDAASETGAAPGASRQASGPAPPKPPVAAPLPPFKPADHAPAPPVAPSGATTAFDPRNPAPDTGCTDRLEARGVAVEVTTLGPQPDQRCTVVQPLRLVSARLIDGTSVAFPDKPTVACTTADAFSAYVHDLLAPLAKGTWGVGLASVWTGPGLECRSRDHVFGAKLSAHGQGLAVDIAQLKLDDGRLVVVGEPKTDAERDFETAARAGGCGYFHTVLGPGSDSYHRTHWHFDLEVRGKDGDGKFCK